MNRKRLLAVASFIENSRPSRGFEFSMSNDLVWHSCGYVGCIAGATVIRYGRSKGIQGYAGNVIESARNLLGLTFVQADQLFGPRDCVWSTVSKSVAVRCLRHAAKTGRIDFIKAGAKPCSQVSSPVL